MRPSPFSRDRVIEMPVWVTQQRCLPRCGAGFSERTTSTRLTARRSVSPTGHVPDPVPQQLLVFMGELAPDRHRRLDLRDPQFTLPRVEWAVRRPVNPEPQPDFCVGVVEVVLPRHAPHGAGDAPTQSREDEPERVRRQPVALGPPAAHRLLLSAPHPRPRPRRSSRGCEQRHRGCRTRQNRHCSSSMPPSGRSAPRSRRDIPKVSLHVQPDDPGRTGRRRPSPTQLATPAPTAP